MPIIRNALNVYRSMPTTRCSNAPASGTVTRYPPANSPFGPHSSTTRTGSLSRITWARHVYQAGSRVGAERLGSARNFQPSTSSISSAKPPITHHDPSQLEPRAG